MDRSADQGKSNKSGSKESRNNAMSTMEAVGLSAPETRANKQRKRSRCVSNKDTNPSKKSRGHDQRSSDSEENEREIMNLPGSSTQGLSPEESCQVLFCRTSLMASSSSSGSSAGILKGIFDTLPFTQHWFAAFVYGDDEVLVCEAAQDESGDLKGKWTLQDMKHIEKISHSKRLIIKRTISKEDVKRTVMSMENGGEYDVVDNNCQTWLHKLFERLGLPTEQLAARSAKTIVNAISAVTRSIFK